MLWPASNTLIVTGSLLMPQAPLSILQTRMFTPTLSPVTVVVGSVTDPKVALPCCTDHAPVAKPVGELAVVLNVPTSLHRSTSGPALAGCPNPLNRLIVTWSVVVPGTQGPLFTVHWNTLFPKPRPVICVLGSVGDTIVPLPLIKVQVPIAGAMRLLPSSTVLVIGVHRL